MAEAATVVNASASGLSGGSGRSPFGLTLEQIDEGKPKAWEKRSSVELVAATIVTALTQARQLDARTVTMAALATGFGPLLMEDFGAALRTALEHDWVYEGPLTLAC